MKNRTQKNKSQEKKFTIGMQKKLVVLFGLLLLAFAGLSARLIGINNEDGEQYSRIVLAQQDYQSRTLPYRRGDILDATGTTLAASEKVYNLVIDSKVINAREAYYEPTMTALAQCFPMLNMSEIRTYVKENSTSAYYVPVKQLTYDEISEFLGIQNETRDGVLVNSNVRGIWFEEEYKRYYPGNTLACDVIGFTTSDNAGLYGLEEYYDDVLNGTTGREYGYLNEDYSLKRTIKPAVDGNTIVSTIDVNIQSIVERHLKAFDTKYRDNAREGDGSNNTGCIIMDVNSGEILSMASYPVFDLNNPKDSGAYFTESQIAAYTEEGTLEEMQNSVWKNFCIADSYEPGSTMKPFTVAAALESGAIDGSEHYECNGLLTIGGHDISCHNRLSGGDGWIGVKEAVEQSCNVALMYIGSAIGKETFSKYQEAFNFGLRTNIDLAGETRTVGLVYTGDYAANMGPAELATSSFGQGFNATMIQMITGFSSLINGGYYYEPHMVKQIVSPSGAVVENIEPRVLKQTISRETSETIKEYCNGVVTNGTGKTARPAGYAIGGKTGTAETIPRKNNEYVVSFIGYAPADDPQIAIYVVIDRPNIVPQDQARLATVLTRDILTEVLPYLNIYMTEELSEKEIQELEEKKLEITTMYSAKPEETVSDGDAGEGSEESGEGRTEGSDEEEDRPWEDFPIDPTTGYAVDPSTGAIIDPDTGAILGGSAFED